MVTTNGPFEFVAPVPDGSPYLVEIFEHPTGQTCGVANPAGTIDGADVSDVMITCSGDDAALASLAASPGELTPAFDPAILVYTVSVPFSVETISITATPAHPLAEIALAGAEPGALAIGHNAIDVVVTAPGGTVRTDAIDVIRADADVALASLAVDPGTLTPAFDPEVLGYSVSVPWTLGGVSITAVPMDPAAEVSVVGDPTALAVGLNAIDVVVTAPGGTTQTYRLDVSRAAPAHPEHYVKASNTSAGAYFGQVAIDGETMVVGTSEPNLRTGAAYVFVHDGSTWTEQAYLAPAGLIMDDWLGKDVAISGDTIVVGAPGDDTRDSWPGSNQYGAGALYVFTRIGVTWTQEALLRACDDAVCRGPSLGWSVAIAGDVIVAGAVQYGYGSYHGPGSAYVFERVGGAWTEVAHFEPIDSDVVGYWALPYGWSVAVTGDTVAIGDPRDTSTGLGVGAEPTPTSGSGVGSGAVWIYRKLGAVWSVEAFIKPESPSTVQFGRSLSLDGDRLAVSGHDGVWIYGRSGTEWSLDPTFSSPAGSVALDGELLVVGSSEDGDAGAANVHDHASGSWTAPARLTAFNTDVEDLFGDDVALSGGTIVIAAPREDSAATGIDGDGTDDSAADAGAVYTFN